MKALAIIFGVLFLAGIAEFWNGLTMAWSGGDGGRADLALGIGLMAFAGLGGTIQLAVHALDLWLRRRRR